MALEFEDKYKFTEEQTKFNAREMNDRFEDVDRRLHLLESNNVLTFFKPGVLATGDIVNFIWPFLSQNFSIGLAAVAKPVGSDILLQLTVGGIDVFLPAERPKITDNLFFGVFSGNGTGLGKFEPDDEATLKLDQVGSGTPGSDLGIVIRGEKALL